MNIELSVEPRPLHNNSDLFFRSTMKIVCVLLVLLPALASAAPGKRYFLDTLTGPGTFLFPIEKDVMFFSSPLFEELNGDLSTM